MPSKAKERQPPNLNQSRIQSRSQRQNQTLIQCRSLIHYPSLNQNLIPLQSLILILSRCLNPRLIPDPIQIPSLIQSQLPIHSLMKRHPALSPARYPHQ
jgi:hypothetical protein